MIVLMLSSSNREQDLVRPLQNDLFDKADQIESNF